MKKEIHNEQKTYLALLFSLCLCLFVSTLFVDQAVAIERKDCDRAETYRCFKITDEKATIGSDKFRLETIYIRALCDIDETRWINTCLKWDEATPEQLVNIDKCISVERNVECTIEGENAGDEDRVLGLANCHKYRTVVGFFADNRKSGCTQWFKTLTFGEELEDLWNNVETLIEDTNKKELVFSTNILGFDGDKLGRTQPGPGGENIKKIIGVLIKIILAVSSTAAVVLLVLYGVRLIYSQHIGNVSQIGDLNKKLINVTFGIIMLLLSFLIFQFINPDILNPTLILGSA